MIINLKLLSTLKRQQSSRLWRETVIPTLVRHFRQPRRHRPQDRQELRATRCHCQQGSRILRQPATEQTRHCPSLLQGWKRQRYFFIFQINFLVLRLGIEEFKSATKLVSLLLKIEILLQPLDLWSDNEYYKLFQVNALRRYSL